MSVAELSGRRLRCHFELPGADHTALVNCRISRGGSGLELTYLEPVGLGNRKRSERGDKNDGLKRRAEWKSCRE